MRNDPFGQQRINMAPLNLLKGQSGLQHVHPIRDARHQLLANLVQLDAKLKQSLELDVINPILVDQLIKLAQLFQSDFAPFFLFPLF